MNFMPPSSTLFLWVAIERLITPQQMSAFLNVRCQWLAVFLLTATRSERSKSLVLTAHNNEDNLLCFCNFYNVACQNDGWGKTEKVECNVRFRISLILFETVAVVCTDAVQCVKPVRREIIPPLRTPVVFVKPFTCEGFFEKEKESCVYSSNCQFK